MLHPARSRFGRDVVMVMVNDDKGTERCVFFGKVRRSISGLSAEGV